jgi:hypothetical protein
MDLERQVTNFAIFTRSFGVYHVPTILDDKFEQLHPNDPGYSFVASAASIALSLISTTAAEDALIEIAEIFDLRVTGQQLLGNDGASLVTYLFVDTIRNVFPCIIIDDTFDDPARLAYTPRVRGGLPIATETPRPPESVTGPWIMNSNETRIMRIAEYIIAQQAQVRGQETVTLGDDALGELETEQDDSSRASMEPTPIRVTSQQATAAAKNMRKQWIWLNATV